MKRFILSAALAVVAALPLAAQGAASANAPLQVAFTFDDLPAHGPLPPGMARPEVVRSILSTLKRENMPPVYGFVNGFRLVKFPYQRGILQAWVRSGNPLGNHTWSHPELDKLSAAHYEANIARNEPLLRELEPHGDWHWFRYPFLEEGNTPAKRREVMRFLGDRGYRVAEVTMDFQDYLWNEPYARCTAKGDETSIRTLHDTYLATADEYIGYSRKLSHDLYDRDIPYVLLMHIGAFDAHMLPELLALFRSRGFGFTTLPAAESDPAYAAVPDVAYPGGGMLLELQAAKANVTMPDATEPEAQLDRLCR